MTHSLVQRIVSVIREYRAEQRSRRSVGPLPRSPGILRWLPSRGNVLFSCLLVGTLLIANRAGAIGLPAMAATSTMTIPYQGRLANALGTPFTGQQSMEFRLYAVPAGGVPLWTEYWTGGNSVSVSDGLFSVLLGSLTTNPTLASIVQANTQLWLGITIGTDSEMTPRVQLGSAAYSMQALSVPDASIQSIKLADQSVTGAKIASSAIDASKIQAGAIGNTELANGSVTAEKAPQMLRIAPSGSLWKLQRGTWCINLTANEYKPTPIIFPEAFSGPPIVFAQSNSNYVGNTAIHISVHSNPTITRSEIFVYSASANNVCGNWIAFGP